MSRSLSVDQPSLSLDALEEDDPNEDDRHDDDHDDDDRDSADVPLVAHVNREKRLFLLPPWFARIYSQLATYAKFIGPGFLIAVAYIDPGNYATDVEAGADTRFALLFIILVSNVIAILFQSLCIKLGSATGKDLAQNCREHLPRWMTIVLYVFAETAIIATDISEVIGSAISFNLLFHIPLVVGCALTLVDTLFILTFYRPNGSMNSLRAFEGFVTFLVLGVVICFCIELSFIDNVSLGDVLVGYLPSAAIVQGKGLYLSCGIVGATVMPHSLFLGSGLVQARLKEFDVSQGHLESEPVGQGNVGDDKEEDYRPSISAIRACLKYSIIELAVSLLTFATFVNSAILIVSGSSLYQNPDAGHADLFGIYELLSQTISPIAGTVFALALLFSGMSAGVIGTIAGQMVSEGMLHWTVSPWLRRLITRSISIVPSVIIAAAVGREGLDAALTASQVALSILLPVVSAPLIYFTARDKYMTVRSQQDGQGPVTILRMKNHWSLSLMAIFAWLLLTGLNVAALVFIALGDV